MVALLLIDVMYVVIRLPDWKHISGGGIPKSRFIASYEEQRADNPKLPPLRWKPVPIATIPTHVIRAVVVAEDSRFFMHSGFDTEAFQDAMETNLTKGRFAYGGSTISQQTAKNLFFTPSRNPLRKWHELIFTYFMEKNLRKRRIIEIYLNVAEFGRGVFGVEAAAQKYFNKSIAAVTHDEAIELASTLPAPANHNPQSRTRFFVRHKRTVARHFYAGQEAQPPSTTVQDATVPEATVSETIVPPPPDPINPVEIPSSILPEVLPEATEPPSTIPDESSVPPTAPD